VSISKEFIVHLKGKDYPLYAGVLDAATKAGLRSLRTTVVQIPSPENGHLAVVMARAEFEDGRVFEDVGDCSPASTSPHLAAAALRLASTRARFSSEWQARPGAGWFSPSDAPSTIRSTSPSGLRSPARRSRSLHA